MHFGAIYGDALDQVLRRGGFFAETHSIKGLLALSRLHELPGVEDEFIEDALHWNQVFDAPVTDLLFSDHVRLHRDSVEDGHLQALIRGAVFPLSYLAGATWTRRHGYTHLVESLADTAIERVGYLGHSWTIWCSFLEIEPYLHTDTQMIFAAERFVEFCASQLSTPDWTPAYPIDFSLASHTLEEDEMISSVLSRPGFYGHRLITLAYLCKYRARLSTDQWKHSLKRMYDESQKHTGSAAHDMQVHNSDPSGSLDDRVIASATVQYLNQAPREVHTLTLADAVVELWKHVGAVHRQHLLHVLRIYGDWEVQRTSSGERKKSDEG